MSKLSSDPRKNVKMKVSHNVVAVGIVAGWGGGGARDGVGAGNSCHVHMA